MVNGGEPFEEVKQFCVKRRYSFKMCGLESWMFRLTLHLHFSILLSHVMYSSFMLYTSLLYTSC